MIQEIYQVFKDYYGEDRVDLQHTDRYYIIVHWDSVVITNEYDEHVEITHLYGKVKLHNSGKLDGKPKFLRTEYSDLHWTSGYRHSHIPRLDNAASAREWQGSCLGSGPINHTIAKLQSTPYKEWNDERGAYDDFNYENTRLFEDENTWLLFCFELDKYVHVESVAGTPYFKMRDIGNNNVTSQSKLAMLFNLWHTSGIGRARSKQFIEYVLKSGRLKFRFINNAYTIGMSNSEYILTMSNLFIEWYNSQPDANILDISTESLSDMGFLKQAVLIGDTICLKTNDRHRLPPIASMIGETLFVFKGNEVKLSLRGAHSDSPLNAITIICPDYLGHIAYKLLRFINCKYGKSTDTIDRKDRIL